MCRVARPSLMLLDDGYVAFVNDRRAQQGLAPLSRETMHKCWEGFDVGGLITPRAAPEHHPGIDGGKLRQ